MILRFERVVAPLPHFELRLDFEIDFERLALFGPSGAGKSSLLELITGIRKPQSGRITLGGALFSDAERDFQEPIRARRIGYLPQDDALFRHLTVEKNIRFGRGSDESSFAAVIDALEIRSLLGRRVVRLSGGERRRVALARALLSTPAILLLDEPFNGLDERMRLVAIDQINGAQVPRIVVTHEKSEAETLATRVVMLERGQVVGIGATGELLRR